jgi:sugar-specific transcriptional regulator TrmB
MDYDLFKQRLLTLGLTGIEASVYLYLLENGKEVGGSNIAIGLKVHRQYVYKALPHLMHLGLVYEVPKGKQSKYKAESPIAVEKLGRKQAVSATELARDLESISNVGNEQEFEVIQGKKAMIAFEMDYIMTTPQDTEEYIIGGASGGFVSVMGEDLHEYLTLKEEKNVQVKYLGSESEIAEFYKVPHSFKNQKHRILKRMPDGNANMVIRQNEVCFYSYAHPPHVYIVKSKAVADHYKRFFEMLWDMGEEMK